MGLTSNISDYVKNARSILDMAVGDCGQILKIDGKELEIALLKMGVKIGDCISYMGKAPLGDPVAIGVHGTKISLRKKDAAAVWIKWD